MKRLSNRQRAYLLLCSRKEIWKRTKRNQAIRRKKKYIDPTFTEARNVCISAPTHFKVNTSKERLEFIPFIEKIETSLLNGFSVAIDLSNIEELHPCGTLIFLAKLEIWTSQFPE